MQKLPLIIVLEYGLNVMWTKWKLKYLERAGEIPKSKKKKNEETKIETRERNVVRVGSIAGNVRKPSDSYFPRYSSDAVFFSSSF